MTLEEAIIVRRRQLAGCWVEADLLEEAMHLIRNSTNPPPPIKVTPKGLHADSAAMTVLNSLVAGPADRCELYSALRASLKGSTLSNAVMRLQDRGFIRSEIRLTSEGLAAMGLKGPRQ